MKAFDNDPHELLQEVRTIKAESELTVQRVEEQHQLFMKNLTGELFERARANRDEAEKCLSHPNGNVRILGLNTLSALFGNEDVLFRDLCERTLISDPDDSVRANAMIKLAGSYEATHDRRLASLLAGFVKDEAQSEEIQIAAYFGLQILNGNFQRRPEMIIDFSFPEDVDWSYVESVCESSKE